MKYFDKPFDPNLIYPAPGNLSLNYESFEN